MSKANMFAKEFELLSKDQFDGEMHTANEIEITANVLGSILMSQQPNKEHFRRGVMDSLGLKVISDEYAKLVKLLENIASGIFESGQLILEEGKSAFDEIVLIMANDPIDKRNDILKTNHLTEMRMLNYGIKFKKQYIKILELLNDRIAEKFDGYSIPKEIYNSGDELSRYFRKFTKVKEIELGVRVQVPFEDNFLDEVVEQAQNCPITSYQGFSLLNGIYLNNPEYISGIFSTMGFYEISLVLPKIYMEIKNIEDQLNKNDSLIFNDAIRNIDSETAMAFLDQFDDASHYVSNVKMMLQINLIISILINRSIGKWPFLELMKNNIENKEYH